MDREPLDIPESTILYTPEDARHSYNVVKPEHHHHQKEEEGQRHAGRNDYSDRVSGKRVFTIVRSWWVEMLACLLIVGVLVALAVTLAEQDSRLLKYWRLNLTVNTLIAIYTLIIKVAAGYVLANGTSTPIIFPNCHLDTFTESDMLSRSWATEMDTVASHRQALRV